MRSGVVACFCIRGDWSLCHVRKDGIDFRALWRERAHGISLSRIASQQKRLAAAAAKILSPAVARLAGFLHPGFAAEFLKRVGCFPDFAQAA